MPEQDWNKIRAELAAPFPGRLLKARPGRKMGDSVQMLWFVDARDVAERLTDVLGLNGWDFTCDVESQEDTGGRIVVKGQLSVSDTAGRAVALRSDVGEASKEDEPYKSAVSDCLKRCAVQFGVGAFLYDMPAFYWPLNAKGTGFLHESEVLRFTEKVAEELDLVGGSPSSMNVADLKKRIPGDTTPHQRTAPPPPDEEQADDEDRIPKAPAKPPVGGLSEKQLALLTGPADKPGLLEERLEDPTAYLYATYKVALPSQLTSKQATELITFLFKQPKLA